MYIDKNARRVNLHATFELENGDRYIDLTSYPKETQDAVMQELGIVEIEAPVAPPDFSEETHYRTESDDAPYVTYTRKPQEQLDQIEQGKIAALLVEAKSLREKIMIRINDIAPRLERRGEVGLVALTDNAVEMMLTMFENLPNTKAAAELEILTRFYMIRATLPEIMHKAFSGVDQ